MGADKARRGETRLALALIHASQGCGRDFSGPLLYHLVFP